MINKSIGTGLVSFYGKIAQFNEASVLLMCFITSVTNYCVALFLGSSTYVNLMFSSDNVLSRVNSDSANTNFGVPQGSILGQGLLLL